MSLPQAFALGHLGNEMSEKLTGSEDVTDERTCTATLLGGGLGLATSGVLVVTSITTAPVMVPLAVASAAFAALFSRH